MHDLVSQVAFSIPLNQIVQISIDGREVGIAASAPEHVAWFTLKNAAVAPSPNPFVATATVSFVLQVLAMVLVRVLLPTYWLECCLPKCQTHPGPNQSRTSSAETLGNAGARLSQTHLLNSSASPGSCHCPRSGSCVDRHT